jgi:hypothetical protein
MHGMFRGLLIASLEADTKNELAEPLKDLDKYQLCGRCFLIPAAGGFGGYG